MKRRVSLAVLGMAMVSTSALAGVYIAPADRAARQAEAERRAQHAAREPERQEPRQDARRDERRPDGRDHERRDERRHDRRDHERHHDRRPDGRDHDRHHDRRHDHRDHERRHDRRQAHRDHERRGWRDERGRQWHYSRDWYDRYRAEHFRYDRGRYLARQRFAVGIYHVPRGYVPRYWQRGQWLPSSHHVERRHHLTDYGRFALYEPPFGARWVRVGRDALLVDYGSGEVLDVVFRLFW